MTPLELGTAVLFGAALLALWLDLRLGDRSPQSMVKVLLHAATAFVVVRFAAEMATQIADPQSVARTMGALFLVVLPSWMYAFLASLWTLKLVRGAIAR